VTGSSEYRHEPAGSGATELVTSGGLCKHGYEHSGSIKDG
jgi:hypothetical protein